MENVTQLLSSIHDRGELLSNQRSTTDQTAVNVDLSQQLCSVLVVHGTTVLNGHSLCGILTVQRSNHAADNSTGLLCLLGSSGETDETVNLRTKAALAAGMKVILCLGEVKEQRLSGITDEVVGMQTKLDLAGISAEDLKNVIIAYEPVWAIGTGLTATPEQAEETCAVIRRVVASLYGEDVAESVTIQYGGSMNEKNAAELLAKPNVDGGLIGGASLVAEKFKAIVDAAQ